MGRGGGDVFVWLLSGMTYIPVTLVPLTLNVYGRIEFQTTGDSVRQRYEKVGKHSFETWSILRSAIYRIRQSITQSQTLKKWHLYKRKEDYKFPEGMDLDGAVVSCLKNSGNGQVITIRFNNRD
jgi:hypothetical protein